MQTHVETSPSSSALLKNYVKVLDAKQAGRSGSDSDLWSHIWYSTPRDGNEVVAVVAVVGQVEPGSIAATVVAGHSDNKR